jgi:flavin reductase (DIM6/NTAB) family NADH-FMN oxidoreductase RutF
MVSRSDAAVTPAQFRTALGRFATGVTVVCAREPDGEVHGMTANAFMSVSLAPPLVAVAVRTGARLAGIAEAAGAFSVTVLALEQEAEAARFASLPVRPGTPPVVLSELGGTPVLAGGLAAMSCTLYAVVPAGDHLLYLGEVRALKVGDEHRRPLGFYGSTFSSITPLAGHSVPEALWSGGLDVWG